MFTRPNSTGTAWTSVVYFILVASVISLLAGLGGAGLAWFLHHLITVLYGSSAESLATVEQHTTPIQRFGVLAVTGVVMGFLWWVVRRYGPRLPSPEEAAAGAPMSPKWTMSEAIIEVANVGAGASIGRESAPREVGAMAAERIATWSGLTPDERSVLIACAAGAGLAATYNVPLAGAILGIESVLGIPFLRRTRFGHLAIILPLALAVSYGAVLAGRLVVPNRSVYETGGYESGRSPSLLVLALVLGLLLGPLGHLAGRLFTLSTRRAPKGNQLLLIMPLGYLAIGGLAAWQPGVMGNGHLLAQSAFDLQLTVPSLLLLAGLKLLSTTITMRSGARGGRITPAFSTGAALGAVTGTLWSRVLPLSVSGATLTGGAVVLAIATASPLAAISLSIEMTGAPARMAIPVGLAVAVAWGVRHLIVRAEHNRLPEPKAHTYD